MKKLINLTWILVILMCTGLTSCSDNGDEQQNIDIELLYGSWYYEEYDDGEWYEFFTFHEGGRFENYWEEYNNNGTLIDYGEDTGSWEYENCMLTFPYEDEIVSVYIISLSSETLVLGDSEGATMTLYRAYE